MRVTQSMMVNNMSYWVAQQAEKLQDAQTEVGSGKKINKPSDDPAAAGQIQADRVSLSQYSQYESNIAQAKTWIDASSATLNTVYSTLQNARNAVYSAGGTETPTEPIPSTFTSSITPAINLYSGTATGGTFSATMNIYDSDLKAIPLTITFTKTAANNWSWAAAIPPSMGTIGSGGSGTLAFDADGQLVAGADPTISFDLLGGATTPQVVTWDLYDSGATQRDLTQYAAKSSIGDNAPNIAIGLLTNFYNQILTLANSQYASSYMYAGNLSDMMPFAKVEITSPGVGDDIVYDLASVATNVDIQVIDSAGTVVRNILGTGFSALPLHNTMAWDGTDNAGIDLPEGEYSFIVTASDATGSIAAYPRYWGDDGGKEVLAGVNEKLILNNNGKDIFSSILSNLSRAITAITNDDTGAVSSIGAALQANIKALEAKQVELANASVQLGGSSTRVQQLSNNTLGRISELEMGSPEEAAIKLQAQQTTYEQVISVTANILKMPKLTDYI
jgi:hypothetical protein